MFERLLTRLQSAGVAFTIHTHVPSYTFADAKAGLDFPLERLLKTIAFRHKSGRLVLVALRGQDRVDYRKLAAALDVKRADVFRMTPEEVLAAYGVEVGSVGPLILREDAEVLFDARVLGGETVFCGIGRPDRTLEIGLADLLRLTRGRVLPLAVEEYENLTTIAEKIAALAQVIAAPGYMLPTYGSSDQTGRPHIEVDARGYHFVVAERGSEFSRHTTTDLDEILYDVFRGVTFELACDYELAHRVEGQDFRRILFEQQDLLLKRLSTHWAERNRQELAQILVEHPFVDE